MDWLTRVDPRIYRVIVAIALVIPMVVVLGVPIPIDPNTRDFYAIVTSASRGDAVLVCFDFSAGGRPEIRPQIEQVLEDLFRLDVRVMFVAFVPDGRPMINESIDAFEERMDIVNGVDYANVGYVAGFESGIAAFLADIRSVTPTDVSGVAIDDLPGFRDVRTVEDFAFVITFNTGQPGPAEWVRQMARYSPPLLTGMNSTMFPATQAFLSSGQVSAALNGPAGAAQYESLAGRPGTATTQMDVQAVGHAMFLGVLILGNVVYFTNLRRERREGGKR